MKNDFEEMGSYDLFEYAIEELYRLSNRSELGLNVPKDDIEDVAIMVRELADRFKVVMRRNDDE